MTNDKKNTRRQRYILLFGGVCKRCPSTERLEFDHIDPKTKTSHRIWSWATPRLEAELQKCQLLCRPCHRLKTQLDLKEHPRPKKPFLPYPVAHGTHSGYCSKCRCPECVEAENAYERARYHHDVSSVTNDREKLKRIRTAQYEAGLLWRKPLFL